MVVFLFSPRKLSIRTWFCNCPQYLCLFGIVVECITTKHDLRKMMVLPYEHYWVFSTSDQDSVSFQPILCHPHTQIIILFHDVQRDIPNLEFSPSHASIGSSRIAFSITDLKKDDHINFVQEERLGLTYWTMILAICVVVDESKCLDTRIWEFSIICEHLPSSLGCKLILRLLLVHRNPAIWRGYPWFGRLSFEMLKTLVQWILHKTLSRLLQYHLAEQLVLYIFGALPPIQHFSDVH